MHKSQFNSTAELIEAFRQGEMIVLLDDEDRENEGDLMMAATHVTPEHINFMAQHGRGLICLTITQKRREQLKLPMMVEKNTAHYGTNFTISVEAAKGVSTGISAADRATTIHAAVSAQARPEDLVYPGHIFPVAAQKGGVLTRAGHTEAGCDLAGLAGLEPASVLVEILNPDGTMARRPELEIFAKQHGLKIGTVADLIHYRLTHERQMTRLQAQEITTRVGKFILYAYQDNMEGYTHIALVKGEIDGEKPVLVRVQIANIWDSLQVISEHPPRWGLTRALESIAQADAGVIVLLNPAHAQIDFQQQIMQHVAAPIEEEAPSDLRIIGLGSQILLDLGVRKMRLLSTKRRMRGLSGFGLEVVEYVPIEKEI